MVKQAAAGDAPSVSVSSVYKYSWDSLCWKWVLEALISNNNVKKEPLLPFQAASLLLKVFGMVENIPSFTNNKTTSTSSLESVEEIVLKFLEHWMSSSEKRFILKFLGDCTSASDTPHPLMNSGSESSGIDLNRFILELLLRKVKTASPDDQTMDGAELLQCNSHQFIHTKRATSPKFSTDLEQICKGLQEGRPVTGNDNEVLQEGNPVADNGNEISPDGPPVTENVNEPLREDRPVTTNGNEILQEDPPITENVTKNDNDLMQEDPSECGKQSNQKNSKEHDLLRQLHSAVPNIENNTLQTCYTGSGKQPENVSSLIFGQYNEMSSDEEYERFHISPNRDILNANRIANDSCLKCDQGGLLSKCKGESCSISFHERCVDLLDCDEQGHLYCPLCLCKQARKAYYKAKRRYMQAKKSLECFIGKDMVDHIKTKRRSITNENINDCGSSRKRQKKTKTQNEVETFEIEANHDDSEANAVREQGNEAIIDSINCGDSNPSSVEIINRVNATSAINETHEKGEAIGIREVDTLPQGNAEVLTDPLEVCPEIQNHNHQDQATHVEQENHNPIAQKVNSELLPNENEKRPRIHVSRNWHPEVNSKSPIGESSSCDDTKVQNKPYYEKNSRQSRRYWTPDEEKALKDAMQKVPVEKGENFPWAKIWETIKHAFRDPRQPRDLKDKWRNILNKEAREGKCKLKPTCKEKGTSGQT